MNHEVERIERQIILDRGWLPGSAAENRVAFFLSRVGCDPEAFCQQYLVGPYRLDFAVPAVKFDLEIDGPHHLNPQIAAKDVLRDSWLRSQGWLVIRLDFQLDESTLENHLANILRFIGGMWPILKGQRATRLIRQEHMRRITRAKAKTARQKASGTFQPVDRPATTS